MDKHSWAGGLVQDVLPREVVCRHVLAVAVLTTRLRCPCVCGWRRREGLVQVVCWLSRCADDCTEVSLCVVCVEDVLREGLVQVVCWLSLC